MLARAQWGDFPHRQKGSAQAHRYLGMGLAHGLKGTGRGPFEMALVRVSGNRTVSVLTGASAMGQGSAPRWRRFALRNWACAPRR